MPPTDPPSSSAWEPPSPEELQRLLPQYEITDIIGRGGMGAVYRGRQAKLNRTVAIKVLPETLAQGEDELNFAKRFEQEAQAMAGLDHPGIISVHDFGETAEGQLYIVMEFVDGMDIQQYLHHHGGKLPPEHALSITAHILDALDYAHSHGIVHRDIKPANILLNHEGRVKIADFGLAKRFGEQADASFPALTMSNVAIGTPDFVAPEALDSDQIPDHRADLYAIGVMLYQMLTGKLPRGHFQTPNELNPEIDPRLDDIVVRAMAANPDHRYASAPAMRADLDLVMSQPMAKVESGEDSAVVAAVVPVTNTIKGVKKGPKRSNMPVYLGIGIAAILVVGLVMIATGKKGGSESSTGEAALRILPVASVGETTDANGNVPTAKPDASPVKAKAAAVSPPPAAIVKATEPEKDTNASPLTVAVAEEKSATEPSLPDSAEQGVASDVEADVPAAPEPTPALASDEDPGGTPELRSQSSPLSDLPGLKTRLTGYLTARTTQLGDLAAKYQRGLETRLKQATEAGDLSLVTAFGEEKVQVEALQSVITAPVVDPISSVSSRPSLPELPEGSPAGLVTLRETWTSEREKIEETLDTALRQSLKALEIELTKALEIETAKLVRDYREGLDAEGGMMVAAVDPVIAAIPAVAPAAANSDVLGATKDRPYENSLGMKFVPVEETGVLFCIHEVRYKDYAAYASESQGVDELWKNQSADGYSPTDRTDDHPVIKVNWNDAQAFCAWLSNKEGRTYRLPKDEEWSVAVGIWGNEKWGTDTTPVTVFIDPNEFPWGAEWPPANRVGNYSDQSRKIRAPVASLEYLDGYDDTFPTTAPVMSFEPNKAGVYDLSGNVWEWCEDWYSVDQNERVLRGGSWYNWQHFNLLSSARGHQTQDRRSTSNGFRVVLVPSGPAPAFASRPSPPPVGVPALRPSSDLAGVTKGQPFENSLGMKFVPVPGTKILMCVHETRFKDYTAYADSGEGESSNWLRPIAGGMSLKDRSDHPVVKIRHQDAEGFCAWLSKKEGSIYRLPTDAEWDAGVGIKDQSELGSVGLENSKSVPATYPWGADWPPPAGSGNYSDKTRKKALPDDIETGYLGDYDDGFFTTAPVMSFKPNSLGLYDLGGNVSEWIEDRELASDIKRAIRGSSYIHGQPEHLKSSYRFLRAQESDFVDTGFRIVREQANDSTGAQQTVTTPNLAGEPLSTARLKEIEQWLVGSAWKAGDYQYYFAKNGKGAIQIENGQIFSFTKRKDGGWNLEPDGSVVLITKGPRRVLRFENSETCAVFVYTEGSSSPVVQHPTKVASDPALVRAADE